jgi:two-component system CAI-1 autoinducer sensor kinase/phosphatase CqsS
LCPGATSNTLIFRDTGSGIPAGVLPHVFERFYSGGGDDAVLGSGIGLAFCKDVMLDFGGTITCRSEHGSWTEFELSFPVNA